MKILITTVPFGQVDAKPLKDLANNNIEYTINPLGRKLQPGELAELIDDFDIVIAGTEKIDKKVFDRAKKLKFISRVGIGLDGIDLNYAREKGVKISYTPDAPAPAVAELTIGLMISLARSVNRSNLNIKNGKWERYFGQRLSEMNIGIIGMGRIGSGVMRHLKCFNPKNILVNDIDSSTVRDLGTGVSVCSKDEIYCNSDLISLHIPLTKDTHNMISLDQINKMKKSVYLINTARGGIINEESLLDALKGGKIAGAAIDTYEDEPYFGGLTKFDNCINTAHMGSMTVDCRSAMEIEATQEAIRFIKGVALMSEVPEDEYQAQSYNL
jgi:D-3-phosphoglycerate dehydrogenase / 2-oxoglutarate reductase